MKISFDLLERDSGLVQIQSLFWLFLTAMEKHHLKLEEIPGTQYNDLDELQRLLLPSLAKILADVIRRGLEQKKLKVEMNKVVFDHE